MVYSLGPGKFYGSSLPRPRIYTDVKFNSERVDPPVSVMDPFYSWAEDAHWSMGGLNFKRLRFQGKIEGNVKKLRKQREKQAKDRATVPAPGRVRVVGKGVKKEKMRSGYDSESESESDSPVTPPAPKVTKRRRFVGVVEDECEDDEVVGKKRKLARRLVADFEKAVIESPAVGVRTRRSATVEAGVGDDVMKIVQDLNNENKLKSKSKSRSRVSQFR